MTAVANVAQGVVEARGTLAAVARFLEEATSPDEVAGARDRIKLAREWARISKLAAEMHADLLRVEIRCLQRIVELGATSILRGQEARAAEFYAEQSDDEVAYLIAEYASCHSAVGVFRRHQRDDVRGSAHAAGRAFASARGEYDEPDPDELEALVRSRVMSTRAALAALIEDREGAFTISDLAQELLAEAELPGQAIAEDAAFMQGVAEVCRAAVRAAPVAVVDGIRAPRFITCTAGADFARVPFENATVGQLAEMVELRREQLRQDQVALSRLEGLLETARGGGDDSAFLRDALGADGRLAAVA